MADQMMNQQMQQQMQMQQQEQQQKQLMMEQIKTLPPEEQEAAMMRLFQDYNGQEGVLDAQMAQAQQLRGTQQPQGVQAGNQFVASNPLSNVMSGLMSAKGSMDNREAIAGKKALSDQRTQGQVDVGRSQLQQQAPQQQQMSQQQLQEALLRQMQMAQMQPQTM